MRTLLQLLVPVGIAVIGTVVALYRDKKEHCDPRQGYIHFTGENDDHEQRGAAMSRTSL